VQELVDELQRKGRNLLSPLPGAILSRRPGDGSGG
jgi:hypothetical protein